MARGRLLALRSHSSCQTLAGAGGRRRGPWHMWHQRHSPRRHSSRPTGSLEPFASELEQGPWERAREAAGIQMAKPQLEDEGAPQRRAVVAAPYQMLPHQTAHRSPVQEVVEPAVGHREPIDPMAQRPSEPGAERYGKAQLRVVQDLGRREPAETRWDEG